MPGNIPVAILPYPISFFSCLLLDKSPFSENYPLFIGSIPLFRQVKQTTTFDVFLIPVIKHGLLENGPVMPVIFLAISSSIQFGDFPAMFDGTGE